MSKCYIPEISIRIIRKDEIINNLKSNFTFNKVEKKIICTNDGFYEINDNTILKYVILHKKEFIFENFIDSFTLLVDNTYVKKFGNIDYIPFESQEIEITVLSFDIPESNNKFVLEYTNNRISDFYFQTKEKIIQNNLFLNNDVSLILKTLNV
tara:strand:+ start:11322 stop:11780 length:459 start_codon:yes stop_codon:yes gene_type:complete